MAYEFYVSITGEKQKKLVGECTQKPHQGKIPGSYFQWARKARVMEDAKQGPVPASGTEHEPVIFRKSIDCTSPQLSMILAKNEQLINVLFEFVRTSPKTGEEEIYYTIELTKAWVLWHKYFRPFSGDEGQVGPELEEVAFTFDKVEERHKPAGTTAEDHWGQG